MTAPELLAAVAPGEVLVAPATPPVASTMGRCGTYGVVESAQPLISPGVREQESQAYGEQVTR